MTGIYKSNSTILTRTGWKSLEDVVSGNISMGSNILSFNIRSGREEWTPLIGVNLTPSSRAVMITINNKDVIVSEDSLWVVKTEYPDIDAFVGEGLPESDIRLFKTSELLPLLGDRYSYGNSMSQHRFKVRVTPFSYNIGMRSNDVGPYIDTKDISYKSLDYNYETWSPITLNGTYFVRYSGHIFLMGCYSDNIASSNGITIDPLFLTSYSPGEKVEIPSVSAYSSSGEIRKLILLERPTPNVGNLKVDSTVINSYPRELPINSNISFVPNNSNVRGRITIPYNVIDNQNRRALIPSTITIQIGTVTSNNTDDPDNGIDFNILNSLYQQVAHKDKPGGYVGLDSNGKINSSYIDRASLGITVDWTQIPEDIELPYPPVRWEDILNKPDTFEPSFHEHPKEDVPPITDSLSWNQITNKPTQFTPSTHVHNWSSIKEKPSNFVFINDKISLLRNDAGYLNRAQVEQSINNFIKSDSFSLYGKLNIGQISLNLKAITSPISPNISIGTHHIKVLSKGKYLISLSLQLPLINPQYSYLTKYKITVSKGSFKWDFFCSGINTFTNNDFINFSQSFYTNLDKNVSISVDCSLQDEDDPSILPSFFQLLPSINFLSLIKL